MSYALYALLLAVLALFGVCIMVLVPHWFLSNRRFAICVVLLFIVVFISFLVANKAGILDTR